MQVCAGRITISIIYASHKILSDMLFYWNKNVLYKHTNVNVVLLIYIFQYKHISDIMNFCGAEYLRSLKAKSEI